MKTYIRFEMLEKKPKTEVYGIFSVHHEDQIGTIYWYGPWRQYVFDPWRDTIWNRDCLEDVQKFLNELMNERKKVVS